MHGGRVRARLAALAMPRGSQCYPLFDYGRRPEGTVPIVQQECGACFRVTFRPRGQPLKL
jgi:hypothetical protein